MSFFLQESPISELVATYEPDVVVEMLGVNDLTRSPVCASASLPALAGHRPPASGSPDTRDPAIDASGPG